jgi:hypothetical protein
MLFGRARFARIDRVGTIAAAAPVGRHHEETVGHRLPNGAKRQALVAHADLAFVGLIDSGDSA